MHCPLTWKHMTLLLLRSWDDNGQEGHSLVMKSTGISTLKGLWFLSYFGVKYIGRVTHDTVFGPFWYESTVTSVVRSRILRINYFGLHVSLLTFMSWHFTCLVWNWATIFGAVSKRPCQQAYFVTPQYPYTTHEPHPHLSRSSSFGWYIPGWIWICSGTTHFKNKN